MKLIFCYYAHSNYYCYLIHRKLLEVSMSTSKVASFNFVNNSIFKEKYYQVDIWASQNCNLFQKPRQLRLVDKYR